jgi:uncharacterized protein YycO
MCALIHLTTRSRWNHAALDIGDGMMVEATGSGVAVNPIRSLDEMHAVGPPLQPGLGTSCASPPCQLDYTGNDLEETLAWATARVGQRYGYLNAVFCGMRNLFPGWSIVQDQAFICSQLVAEATERAGHYYGKDSAQVSPGDLAAHFGAPR